MASVLTFDQIHRLKIEEYFKPMNLPEEEKRRRADLTEQLEMMFLRYFVGRVDSPDTNWGEYLVEAFVVLAIAFLGRDQPPAFIRDHVETIVNEFVNVTERRAEEDSYWTSDDRALKVAEDQANFVGNFEEYSTAVRNGRRTKTWDTILDGRERNSHHDENGVTVPISEPFHLPGGDLMFPGDTSLGASADEIANCRCHVSYN